MEQIYDIIAMFKNFSYFEWKVYLILHLFFMIFFFYYLIVYGNKKQEVQVRGGEDGDFQIKTKSDSFFVKISMFLLVQLLSLISVLMLFDIVLATVEIVLR